MNPKEAQEAHEKSQDTRSHKMRQETQEDTRETRRHKKPQEKQEDTDRSNRHRRVHYSGHGADSDPDLHAVRSGKVHRCRAPQDTGR